MNPIGTLSENSLHAAIKDYLFRPGDQLESPLNGFIIDLQRGNRLFEVQVKNFYQMKPKLTALLEEYFIQLVHPIPASKWIVRYPTLNSPPTRRKSPKKGSIYQIFDQMVYLGDFMLHPHFSLAVLMIEQEDILLNDGKGSWRRKGWSLKDQRLIRVLDQIHFDGPTAYQNLLPAGLPSPFLVSDLVRNAHISPRLAQKTVYTLTKTGLLTRTGKRGNAFLYQHKSDVPNKID